MFVLRHVLADASLGQPTVRDTSCPAPLSSGASAATMLIFILPAAFYLKLVKKEPLRSPQKVGVSKTCNVPYCISTTQGKSENTHGLEK